MFVGDAGVERRLHGARATAAAGADDDDGRNAPDTFDLGTAMAG